MRLYYFIILISLFHCGINQAQKCNRFILHFPALVNHSNLELELSIDSSLKKCVETLKQGAYRTSPTPTSRFSLWWCKAQQIYFSWQYPIAIEVRRFDPELPFYMFEFPAFICKNTAREVINKQFNSQHIMCEIDEDCSVKLTDNFNLSSVSDLQEMPAYWHYACDTIGRYANPQSDYLPHRFSLLDLAPNQAKGVTIALIDTGVAAFKVSGDRRFYKHNDLAISYQQLGIDNLNVTNGTLSPINLLIERFKPYCSSAALHELKYSIIGWIEQYKINSDEKPIVEFLVRSGTPEISNQKELTAQGLKALSSIIKEISTFNVGLLEAPYNHYAILNFLPAPYMKDYQTTFLATHGTHVYGILAAHPEKNTIALGLAPNANVVMIKAFDEEGVSSKSVLIAAIKKAQMLKADIANLSLKIADELDTTAQSSHLLEDMIAAIPYVVAASGNEGDPSRPGYRGVYESYPARFDSIAFDVGAFAVDKKGAFIPAFSQYELNHGPLFVAPGINIYSTDFHPYRFQKSAYIPRHGTSMASALMSGIVALILGEFKEQFSKEQLLKICYRSARKLNNTSDWQERVLLGALDARTALFILHTIRELKKNNVQLTFDQMAAGIFHLLEQPLKDSTVELPSALRSIAIQMDDAQNIPLQHAINNSHLCFAQLPERARRLINAKGAI